MTSTFSFAVVLEASKFEAGQLLEQHLKMISTFKKNGYPLVLVLWEWKSMIDGHFESFDTKIIIILFKEMIQHLSSKDVYPKHFEYLLSGAQALISRLCIRNWQLEDESKNEQILAKELLQEFVDTMSKTSLEHICKPLPIQHLITQQNCTTPWYETVVMDRSPYDCELMKILLDCITDVNEVDSDGNTILHTAVGSFSYDYRFYLDPSHAHRLNDYTDRMAILIKILVENGVNPNARNSDYALASDLLGSIVDDHTDCVLSLLLKEYELQCCMTLKHKAAVAVKQSKLPYENLLPTALVKLVNLLGENPEDEYSDSD